MTDKADLLRAIVTNQDEDTPRLMFADWLDENATTDAEQARAEFIRVQIKLDEYGRIEHQYNERRKNNSHMRPYGGSCECQRILPEDRLCPFCFSRNREEKILIQHESAWRRPPCPACAGRGDDGGHAWDRGMKCVCAACNGNGSTGVLSEVRPTTARPIVEGGASAWKYTVTWQRGFPVVEVDFDAMGLVLPSTWNWCWASSWIDWATRAVREEAASFHVTGRQPTHREVDGAAHWFKEVTTVSQGYVLPKIIFDFLSPYPGIIVNEYYRECQCDSQEVAHAALDSAVTRDVVSRAYPQVTV